MKAATFASLLSFAVLSVSADRTITVRNQCGYTIWPGLFTNPDIGKPIPSQQTGWEMQPHSSMSFNVPDNWTAGRIWPRTECDFSSNPGPLSCATGGCNGGLLCASHGGTGVPPATLAEFTLVPDGQDNYDVSLVDGFNVPLEITTTTGCPVASCPADLNSGCPPQLQTKDKSGRVVGCKSDCLVDPNPQNSPSCCSGSHNVPATCPNSGVPHYSYFKGRCPNSYAYAYDESSGTALWTCPGNKRANYIVTFCP